MMDSFFPINLKPQFQYGTTLPVKGEEESIPLLFGLDVNQDKIPQLVLRDGKRIFGRF